MAIKKRNPPLPRECIAQAAEPVPHLTPLQEACAEFRGKVRWIPERQLFAMVNRVYTHKQIICQANELRRARGARPIFYPGIYSRELYTVPPDHT